MNSAESNGAQSRWKTTSPITPAYRVHWLLRFPFSQAVRQHTIGELLKDPVTRELTLTALGNPQAR